MSQLNYGQVMAKAAQDLQKEMLSSEQGQGAAGSSKYREFADARDFATSENELEVLEQQRMEQMREEASIRAQLQRDGHGAVSEISESDFLSEVTQAKKVLIHFYKSEFERCKIMNKRLEELAPLHLDTKFLKLHAPDAPFFVTKLKVQMLPCVICFDNGKAFDRIVGFDDLGGNDDFAVSDLESRLCKSGAITETDRSLFAGNRDDDDELEPEQKAGMIRRGGGKTATGEGCRDDHDESSDFEDI